MHHFILDNSIQCFFQPLQQEKKHSRLHIEDVFDSQGLPLFVLLLDQFVSGPSHVDTVGRGSSGLLTREVGSSVSVMDELCLYREQAARNTVFGN